MNVFPEPVYPYAKIVELYPANTSLMFSILKTFKINLNIDSYLLQIQILLPV